MGQNESMMAIGNEVLACSQRQVQPVAFSSLPSIRSIPVILEILIADEEISVLSSPPNNKFDFQATNVTFRIGLLSLWLNLMIYPDVSPGGELNIQVIYSLISRCVTWQRASV